MDDRTVQDIVHEANLHQWGIYQNFFTANRVFIVVLMILLFAALGMILNLTLGNPRKRLKATEIIGLVLGIGAVIGGFVQWKDARYEASLKEYYDRLEKANQRFERIHDTYLLRTSRNASEAALSNTSSLPEAHPDQWSSANLGKRWIILNQYAGPHPFEMYVFTELDTLEYMLSKYKLGYVHSQLLLRAVNTFASRCFGSEYYNLIFREVAVFYTGKKELPPDALTAMKERPSRAGYTDDTRQVVDALCARQVSAAKARTEQR